VGIRTKHLNSPPKKNDYYLKNNVKENQLSIAKTAIRKKDLQRTNISQSGEGPVDFNLNKEEEGAEKAKWLGLDIGLHFLFVDAILVGSKKCMYTGQKISLALTHL
jgi:hypothetical protein